MALCSRQRRFAIAQAGQKRDPGLETAGKLANVGLSVDRRQFTVTLMYISSRKAEARI
jgi:hypothetical protein